MQRQKYLFRRCIIIKKQAGVLDMMDNEEIEITHDFYLKKFQLSNPVLRMIIFYLMKADGSAAMLDIFLRTKRYKSYRWRRISKFMVGVMQ